MARANLPPVLVHAAFVIEIVSWFEQFGSAFLGFLPFSSSSPPKQYGCLITEYLMAHVNSVLTRSIKQHLLTSRERLIFPLFFPTAFFDELTTWSCSTSPNAILGFCGVTRDILLLLEFSSNVQC